MKDRRNFWLLLAIVLVGLALRLPQLNASFYGDEAFSLLRDSSRLITESEDRFRPVFFSLLYLWRCLGFYGEVGLRLLPVLFGLLQIPIAYVVGRRLGGQRFAALFGSLIAVSPLLIEFSQELRMYSLVALLALVQAWIFLMLKEKPSLWKWTAFALVAVAGVYTHLHYWLFLAGFGLAFIQFRREIPLRQAVVVGLAVVGLYLPNVPNILAFIARRGEEYGVDLPSAFPKLLTAFTVGFNYFVLPDLGATRAVGTSVFSLNWPLLLAAAPLFALLLWGLIQRHRRGLDERLLLAHDLFTIPVLLAFAAMVITGKYWLQPKYIIFSAPFALLLLAEGCEALRGRVLKWSAAGLGVLVVAIAIIHFWNPRDYGRREDWRGVAATLKAEMTDESVLLILPGNYSLLEYYWPGAKDKYVVVDSKTVFLNAPNYENENMPVYLWWNTAQSAGDPQNALLSKFRQIETNGSIIQFNPRLRLYVGTEKALPHNPFRIGNDLPPQIR